MKQLILVIMLATALGGCYVGVRSPIYGGTTEPPAEQEETRSPLTDSNRRPLLTITRDHA